MCSVFQRFYHQWWHWHWLVDSVTLTCMHTIMSLHIHNYVHFMSTGTAGKCRCTEDKDTSIGTCTIMCILCTTVLYVRSNHYLMRLSRFNLVWIHDYFQWSYRIQQHTHIRERSSLSCKVYKHALVTLWVAAKLFCILHTPPYQRSE